MKFKRKLILMFGFCVLAFLPNCSKRQTINKPSLSVDEQYEAAMNDFKQKRYDKAINGFSNIIFNFPGSRYAGDAQYYLSLSYFEKKDYPQAIIEFDFFVRNFPASVDIEPALVKLALSYLRSASSLERDQTQLLKAQELIEELLERFANTKYYAEIESAQKELLDRLAHKEFNAANLYFRAQEYEAARVYFQHILDEYPQTSWAAQAKLPLAICFIETGAKEPARQILEVLVKDDSNPDLQKKAEARLKKLFLK